MPATWLWRRHQASDAGRTIDVRLSPPVSDRTRRDAINVSISVRTFVGSRREARCAGSQPAGPRCREGGGRSTAASEDCQAPTVQQRVTNRDAHAASARPTMMPMPTRIDTRPSTRSMIAAARRAERHPDPDLGPPQADGIRRDPVEPDGCHQESEPPERRRQQRQQALLDERVVHPSPERTECQREVPDRSRQRLRRRSW